MQQNGDGTRFGMARVDAVLPKEMARLAEAIGYEKASEDASALLVPAGQHTELAGGVGASLLDAAERLRRLGVVQVFFPAVLGNTLLCLGVWLTYSARTTTDRVLALTSPVVAFYAMGLERAVAVMSYLSCAALIGAVAGGDSGRLYATSSPATSLGDLPAALAPVTLGNIVGGGVLVALATGSSTCDRVAEGPVPCPANNRRASTSRSTAPRRASRCCRPAIGRLVGTAQGRAPDLACAIFAS